MTGIQALKKTKSDYSVSTAHTASRAPADTRSSTGVGGTSDASGTDRSAYVGAPEAANRFRGLDASRDDPWTGRFAQIGVGATGANPMMQNGDPWTFRVWSSETLAPIAERFGVTEQALRQANGLPNDRVTRGQVLTIPGWQAHNVQAGETLYGLAQRFGGTPESIARANGMAVDDTLRVGARIAVPQRDGAQAGAGDVDPVDDVQAVPPAPNPDDGRYTPEFLAMVNEVRGRDDIPESIKVVMVAQAIEESARGHSHLAQEATNFWGMQNRPEVNPGEPGIFLVTPTEPNGMDWERFTDPADAVQGYMDFIERAPYAGYRDHLATPGDYLRHIGGTWAENPAYIRNVTDNFGEARQLLGL